MVKIKEVLEISEIFFVLYATLAFSLVISTPCKSNPWSKCYIRSTHCKISPRRTWTWAPTV